MKCIKCGVELSTVKDNFSLMIQDYTVNKKNHVCDPKQIESHQIDEKSDINEMVKDVHKQQSEIHKSKIINPEIMNIPMDAPAKILEGWKCRCIHFDGTCHHCGNK